MSTILSIENLTVRFNTPKGMVPAVENVTFSLKAGEIFALLGETGCGKSVTGRSILGLAGENAIVNGSIRFNETELLTLKEPALSRIRGNRISIILQNPDLALNPVQTIGTQLVEPLTHHWKLNSSDAMIQVEKSLAQMGFDNIRELLKKYPFQLSGGMNQRVLIAAAMLTEPELLIADEPTRGLDSNLKEVITQRLSDCRKKNGTTILLITHDLEMASALANRVGVMYDGEFVEVNHMSSFLKEPYHPYSRSLLKSHRGKVDSPDQRTPVLSNNSSSGCSFAHLCRYQTPQCLNIKPEMISQKEGEVRCLLYTRER